MACGAVFHCFARAFAAGLFAACLGFYSSHVVGVFLLVACALARYARQIWHRHDPNGGHHAFYRAAHAWIDTLHLPHELVAQTVHHTGFGGLSGAVPTAPPKPADLAYAKRFGVAVAYDLFCADAVALHHGADRDLRLFFVSYSIRFRKLKKLLKITSFYKNKFWFL